MKLKKWILSMGLVVLASNVFAEDMSMGKTLATDAVVMNLKAGSFERNKIQEKLAGYGFTVASAAVDAQKTMQLASADDLKAHLQQLKAVEGYRSVSETSYAPWFKYLSLPIQQMITNQTTLSEDMARYQLSFSDDNRQIQNFIAPLAQATSQPEKYAAVATALQAKLDAAGLGVKEVDVVVHSSHNPDLILRAYFAKRYGAPQILSEDAIMQHYDKNLQYYKNLEY